MRVSILLLFALLASGPALAQTKEVPIDWDCPAFVDG
jgi:hypothetical protein